VTLKRRMSRKMIRRRTLRTNQMKKTARSKEDNVVPVQELIV